jgi:hypothetical protein
MKRIALQGAAILMAMSGAAYAQANPASPPAPTPNVVSTPTAPEDATQQNGAGLRAQLKGNLEQAGFTNVAVMADAFLVEATDKSGNRVTMFINPHSLTVISDGNVGSKSQKTGGAFAAVPPTKH